MAIYTLFFGRAIRGGAELTDSEWQAFVDTAIVANLPKGYTVMDAQGGWMGPTTHRSIKEATKVVVVAMPDGPDGLAAVTRVRTAYQVEFQQQLVGMTVEHGCGIF